MVGLEIVLIFLLGVIALIDFNFKSVPSIFLTGTLFIVAVIQFFYFNSTFALMSGIAFFIFSYILYEAEFIGGVADIKIITIIGFMINSYNYLLAGILLILVFGFVYKLGYKIYLKVNHKEVDYETEIPFIPCLFLVYITLLICGGIA